ncbi:uncharacterized protein PHACADRAFT_122677, partial [Phanerochaete carnosa HHB-10118-sp]
MSVLMPGDINVASTGESSRYPEPLSMLPEVDQGSEPKIASDGAGAPSPHKDSDPARLSSHREELKRQDSSQPEVKSAWTFLLDSAEECDQIKTGKWKGELDNILVFAGLFSTVVTGFTVESFSWLQEDPADTTNRLLLQMSAQMASFSTSPGFINSTAPPAPQNITSTVFQPDSTDVTINMLWFLSLTLSLLAAFFSIAVQQWLRALPLPGHLPVLDSIRLWEYRTDQLVLWQLPNIIILLPVSLQVSVVLFLTGLYQLLRSLN